MIRLRSITTFCSSGYVKTLVLRNIGLDGWAKAGKRGKNHPEAT